MLLLTLFSFRWHLFPAAGGDGLSGLVLPAVTLAASMVGVFAQVMRAGVERALEEPFALSARARGSGETAVRFRHALRHAMVPVVTLSGWVVGTLFSGAVVVETVFSRQGLGRVLATAIQGRTSRWSPGGRRQHAGVRRGQPARRLAVPGDRPRLREVPA
ncbi:ABC transporter permease [Streptomyces sp. M19]